MRDILLLVCRELIRAVREISVMFLVVICLLLLADGINDLVENVFGVHIFSASRISNLYLRKIGLE